MPFFSSLRLFFKQYGKRFLCICGLFVLLVLFFLQIKPDLPAIERENYRTGLLEQMEHAESFTEFANALFCYEATSDSITTAYTLKKPKIYGIPDLPPMLTDFSLSGYERQVAKQTKERAISFFSNCMESFDDASLNADEQLTYTLLKNRFSLEAELAGYPYYEELLGGSSGIQANLPVTLGEYPLYTERNVKTYLSLLSQIPDYFQNVTDYEKKRASLGYTTPYFVLQETKDNLEQMLSGFEKEDNCFVETFEQRISQIESLSQKKRASYNALNRESVQKYVIPAYQKLYDYVSETLASCELPDSSVSTGNNSVSTDDPTGSTNHRTGTSDSSASSGVYSVNKDSLPKSDTPYGLSTFPNGSAYYELLVKSNTGSSHSVPELIEKTETTLKQSLGDVLEIALTDQAAYLYYCDHSLETYYESPHAILEALSLMMRKNYPPLDKLPAYEIKTVPKSLAPSLSPAFYMIPPMDDYENNTIYINDLYTSPEKGNLFTTLAHEGFPGHLYQTVYFNSGDPLPLRHLLDYPGYAEGWATYAEIDAFSFLDYPLEGDSLCRLYQADTMINLALCSRIDMGVNYENWTLADVDRFFTDNGFNSYFAADVYTYVVEAPATYLRYFIGYLEILDLKEFCQHEKTDTYSEKMFHEKFLNVGPGDFETIKKYLLK